jgi:hypothetical protein
MIEFTMENHARFLDKSINRATPWVEKTIVMSNYRRVCILGGSFCENYGNCHLQLQVSSCFSPLGDVVLKALDPLLRIRQPSEI